MHSNKPALLSWLLQWKMSVLLVFSCGVMSSFKHPRSTLSLCSCLDTKWCLQTIMMADLFFSCDQSTSFKYFIHSISHIVSWVEWLQLATSLKIWKLKSNQTENAGPISPFKSVLSAYTLTLKSSVRDKDQHWGHEGVSLMGLDCVSVCLCVGRYSIT